MPSSIRRYLLLILKNIEKIIALTIFLCTFSGAWFLFSYARSHGVRFIDLIQTNFLISAGALFFFITFFIIGCFLISFNFSPVIAQCLYHDILVKEKIGDKKKRRLIYMLYFTLCGISFSVLFHNLYAGCFILFLIILFFHTLTINKPFLYKGIIKTIKLSAYTLMLLLIIFFIFEFLSIALNFEIEAKNSINGIIQTIFIFFMTITLAGIGLADIHQRNRDIRNRTWCYLFFALLTVFYIATAFSSSVSEQIARMIGLGYTERCYYKKDLDNYSIPANLIQIQKNKNNKKMFIIADVNGRMYISMDKKHVAAFSFTAKELSEVGCEK